MGAGQPEPPQPSQYDVIAAAGTIQPLVQLRSDSALVQAQAAEVLVTLNTGSPSNDGITAAASAIPALLQLLWSGNVLVQEPAAWALVNLSADSPANRADIAAAGGTPPLVQLLHSNSAAVQQQAARAIVNLSYASTGHIVVEGAIPPLVLHSDKAPGRLEAALVLAILRAAPPTETHLWLKAPSPPGAAAAQRQTT
jgi:hypothetical protein